MENNSVKILENIAIIVIFRLLYSEKTLKESVIQKFYCICPKYVLYWLQQCSWYSDQIEKILS